MSKVSRAKLRRRSSAASAERPVARIDIVNAQFAMASEEIDLLPVRPDETSEDRGGKGRCSPRKVLFID
jgi:hypothetical protein